MTNRYIIDRQVPERTHLSFYFPKPTQGEDYYIVRLPFFENVIIKESKKAKYQKYSLISRSSNLYSYLGADSKQLNLSFNMTLPHILDQHSNLTLESYTDRYTNDKDNVESEKKKFKKPTAFSDGPTPAAKYRGLDYISSQGVQDTAKMVLQEAVWRGSLNIEDIAFLSTKYGIQHSTFENQMSKQSLLKVGQAALLMNPVAGLAALARSAGLTATANDNADLARAELDKIKYRIIETIIYWTNIVRASVVNNAKNPIYGPPIIRLNHGILYQDIPCICTSYSIDYNEAAGYDVETLLPHQLKISMKLEEIRTGDFGAFPTNANEVVKRDNLAGWESVVLDESHSMDPGSLKGSWPQNSYF